MAPFTASCSARPSAAAVTCKCSRPTLRRWSN